MQLILTIVYISSIFMLTYSKGGRMRTVRIVIDLEIQVATAETTEDGHRQLTLVFIGDREVTAHARQAIRDILGWIADIRAVKDVPLGMLITTPLVDDGAVHGLVGTIHLVLMDWAVTLSDFQKGAYALI